MTEPREYVCLVTTQHGIYGKVYTVDPVSGAECVVFRTPPYHVRESAQEALYTWLHDNRGWAVEQKTPATRKGERR